MQYFLWFLIRDLRLHSHQIIYCKVICRECSLPWLSFKLLSDICHWPWSTFLLVPENNNVNSTVQKTMSTLYRGPMSRLVNSLQLQLLNQCLNRDNISQLHCNNNANSGFFQYLLIAIVLGEKSVGIYMLDTSRRPAGSTIERDDRTIPMPPHCSQSNVEQPNQIARRQPRTRALYRLTREHEWPNSRCQASVEWFAPTDRAGGLGRDEQNDRIISGLRWTEACT
jgi:hypothetical protein